MSAVKDSKSIHDSATLTKSQEILTNKITKDPFGIVKEYSAIYFDLPLVQRYLAVHNSLFEDMSFLTNNTDWFSKWGIDFAETVNKYRKKGYSNFMIPPMIVIELDNILNKHIIGSEDIEKIVFECNIQSNKKPYESGNPPQYFEVKNYSFHTKFPEKFARDITATVVERMLLDFKQYRPDCDFPVEVLRFENGTLYIRLSNANFLRKRGELPGQQFYVDPSE